MSLSPGTRRGHYDVTALLGDTRLDRVDDLRMNDAA